MRALYLTLLGFLFSLGLFAQDARFSIPSDDETKTALATIKDVFKDEYNSLKTPNDRKMLAKKLLGQALDSSNTPAMVYMLISESARIAGEAGDIAVIVEASNLYVKKFEGDDIAARWNMLEAAEKAASKLAPEALSLLAEEYLKLADEAIIADDFKNATELANNAARVAKKAKNTSLVTGAAEKKKEAADAINALKNVSASMDKLKTNPDDPDANSVVGKYICLTKGDWDKGLPILAKGSDKDYQEAAELELSTRDTTSKMKSADKWWDMADKEKLKTAKEAVMSHAVTLYKKVFPELGGIEKVKVEKRMEAFRMPLKAYLDITNKIGRMWVGGKSKNNIVNLPQMKINKIAIGVMGAGGSETNGYVALINGNGEEVRIGEWSSQDNIPPCADWVNWQKTLVPKNVFRMEMNVAEEIDTSNAYKLKVQSTSGTSALIVMKIEVK